MKIGVVGDIILDRYVELAADRLAQEAPVPVFREVRRWDELGGAANVASKLKDLGAEPVLVGAVGEDSAGTSVMGLLSDKEISWEHVEDSAFYQTPLKTRHVCGGNVVMRLDREEPRPLNLSPPEDVWKDCRAVVVSDYGKGAWSRKLLGEGFPQMHVVVDPCIKTPLDAYATLGAVLVPNLDEMTAIASCAEVESWRRLLWEINAEAWLVTLGKNGIQLVTHKLDEHIETRPVERPDVTGAGDAVAASVAFWLAKGRPLLEVVHRANEAGGQAVRQRGVGCLRKP